jgi:hypothetical protein
MRKQVFIIALLFAFSLFGNGIVYAQKAKNDSNKKHQKEKITEPTAKEALNLILSNGDIPLTVDSSCKSVGSSPDDKTILDYISGLMSFQTEPESSNRIEYSFTRKEEKKYVYWVCDLMFLGKDSEDVWSYGVRFTMRNSDRKLLRESVKCIGSG